MKKVFVIQLIAPNDADKSLVLKAINSGINVQTAWQALEYHATILSELKIKAGE